ncbi:MAG: GNAT family N-acetyltransferase [Phycisphaerales bacterium]|nr:GNAT family N-acetyltransferase [Phycisphaerales bacterium]
MDESVGLDESLKQVSLDDKATFEQAFSNLKQPISDYSFASVWMWSDALALRWKVIERHLCVFSSEGGDLTMIVPPLPMPGATERDMGAALGASFEIMDRANDRAGRRSHSRIEYVSDELLERVRASGESSLSATPLWSDYVYDTARLIDLAGGSLKSKRHARSKFVREFPEHGTRPLEADDVEHCITLLHTWASRGDLSHDGEVSDAHVGTDVLRHRDLDSTTRLLRTFRGLGLKSLGLWHRDRLIGFTIGEQLSPSQAMVIAEKCDSDFAGAPQFIFSEFCRQAWGHCPETNVGDDWGIPSLRFTKQSYRPIRLIAKYALSRSPVLVVGGLIPPGIPGENPPHRVEPAVAPHPESPTPAVRPATLRDVPAILEIERTCFETLDETFNKRQVKSLILNPRAPVAVAEIEGRVMGWSVGLTRQHRRSRSGRLYAIAVHPDAQGRHIGRLLAEHTLGELASQGIARIYLEVRQDNETAIALYHRLGFQVRRALPNYYGSGRHGWRMRRETGAPDSMHLFGASEKMARSDTQL